MSEPFAAWLATAPRFAHPTHPHPEPHRPPGQRDRNRVLGALLGVAVAATIAAAGAAAHVLDGPGLGEPMLWIGLLAIPTAVILGAVVGPAAVEAPRWELPWTVFKVAAPAAYIGTAEVLIVLPVLTEPRPDSMMVAWGVVIAPVLAFLLMPLAGPIALVVTVPAAIVWLVLVRLVARLDHGPAPMIPPGRYGS